MQRLACRLVGSFAVLFSLVVPVAAQLTTQTIVSGVNGLVAFVPDPTVPDTFYLVQQSGTVRVLQNGSLLATPFLDLTDAVVSGVEQGLLGMAFHPDPASNWIFLNFTNSDGDTVVARFTRLPGSPPEVVSGSRLDLLWPSGERVIRQPADNHNGGHLAFGPDGYLYIGLGDGGGGNDTFNNAQNPDSLLGKMLRIDVSVDPADQKGYRVPPTNPFVSLIPLGEIWDIGLRNPWRYSFDNVRLGGTGALIIGDVGQAAREEVDYEPAGRGGRNYGWPIREGMIPTPGVIGQPAPLPMVNPLFDYPRSSGVAVTGGYVYRGSALPPAFHGRYFVGDWGSGFVASVGLAINPGTGEAVFTDAIDHSTELGGSALGEVASFAEDLSGELYILRHNAPGAVYKVVANAALLPVAPEGFTPQVNGSDVLLSWAPPVGPAPLQYRLEVGTAPGASNLLVTNIPGHLTSIGASGVTFGQYFVRLRGVNSAGAGPASAELQLFVGCTGVPAPPANVTQTVAGNLVTLSWSAVASVSSYLIEVGTASGGTDLVVPVGATITGVAGTAPSGTYFARLRTQNACGVSAPSTQVVVEVP